MIRMQDMVFVPNVKITMGDIIRDIPVEQRSFFKVFQQIAYRWNYSEVFSDYLMMLMNWFANGTMKEQRDQALKKYDDKEKQLFNTLYNEHVLLMQDMIIKRGLSWYDSLGEMYQAISSSSKASGMGQFFTPPSVCEMMAKITIGIENPKPYQMVAEPCSGSGRMILAIHAIQPLNFYHAIDLDGMCAQMTAINMCFHNAAGVVSHGNGLWLDEVNYNHYIITRVQLSETQFIPLITTADYKKAMDHLEYLQWYTRVMRGEPYVPQEPPKPNKELPVIEPMVKLPKNGNANSQQLELF